MRATAGRARQGWRRSAIAALGLAGAVSCGKGTEGSGPSSQVLTSLVVDVSRDTLHVLDAALATAEGRDQSGARMPTAAVVWSSSASSVATVSPLGLVFAVGAGVAVIRADAGGVSGEVTVRVVPVPVAAIALTPLRVTLAPGESRRLIAQPVDAAGRPLSGRRISWLSTDTHRAEVSDSGLVTARAPGLVAVTAISEGVYAAVDVRVSGPPGPIATVTVTPGAASLSLGETLQLDALTEDADGNVATDRVIHWSSRDTTIATVSSAGLVSALTRGPVVVDATCEGRRGSATVLVVDPLDAIKIRFADPDSGEIVGDTLRIYASIKSRNAIGPVHARVANKETDLTRIAVGAQGGGVAWVGVLNLYDLHYGPYELVVTAQDALGNGGVGTVIFKRGAREGKGGAVLPPKNR
jgi:uncharacterized protein YjdB